MAKKNPSYKEAQDELLDIVEKIEGNEIDIDELAALVERASYLIKFCKNKLKSTEEKLNKTLGEME